MCSKGAESPASAVGKNEESVPRHNIAPAPLQASSREQVSHDITEPSLIMEESPLARPPQPRAPATPLSAGPLPMPWGINQQQGTPTMQQLINGISSAPPPQAISSAYQAQLQAQLQAISSAPQAQLQGLTPALQPHISPAAYPYLPANSVPHLQTGSPALQAQLQTGSPALQPHLQTLTSAFHPNLQIPSPALQHFQVMQSYSQQTQNPQAAAQTNNVVQSPALRPCPLPDDLHLSEDEPPQVVQDVPKSNSNSSARRESLEQCQKPSKNRLVNGSDHKSRGRSKTDLARSESSLESSGSEQSSGKYHRPKANMDQSESAAPQPDPGWYQLIQAKDAEIRQLREQIAQLQSRPLLYSAATQTSPPPSPPSHRSVAVNTTLEDAGGSPDTLTQNRRRIEVWRQGVEACPPPAVINLTHTDIIEDSQAVLDMPDTSFTPTRSVGQGQVKC